MFALALCVNGTIQLCLCDPDPDGCGDHCHECTPEAADVCEHITIEIDAPSVTRTDVDIPETFNVPAIAALPAPARAGLNRPARPAYAKPPDTGGAYISRSTRLYPLS